MITIILRVSIILILAFSSLSFGQSHIRREPTYASVEIFHLALRAWCNADYDLQFDSAFTRTSGREGRPVSRWIIKASANADPIQIELATEFSKKAIRLKTFYGDVWFRIISPDAQTKDFLRLRNLPSIDSWSTALQAQVDRLGRVEEWKLKNFSESQGGAVPQPTK